MSQFVGMVVTSTATPKDAAIALNSTISMTPIASATEVRANAFPNAFSFTGSEGAAVSDGEGDAWVVFLLRRDVRPSSIGANAGINAMKAATQAANAIQSDVFMPGVRYVMPNVNWLTRN